MNDYSLDTSICQVKKLLSQFFWRDDWMKEDEKYKWRYLSVESMNVYLGKKSNLKEGIDCSFQNNFISKGYSYSQSNCRNKDIFYAIRCFYDVGYFNKNQAMLDECPAYD